MEHNLFLTGGATYLAGVFVHAAVNIFNIHQTTPSAATPKMVIGQYWNKGWSTLLISGAVLFIYLLVLPEAVNLKYKSIEVINWIRVFSGFIGIGSQWIAVKSVGVTKKVTEAVGDKIEKITGANKNEEDEKNP